MDGARAHVVRLGRGQQKRGRDGRRQLLGDVCIMAAARERAAEDAEADGAAVPRATRPRLSRPRVDTQGKDDQADNGGRSAPSPVHSARRP